MKNILISTSFAACLWATPSLAQQPERGQPADKQGWEVSVGAGAIYAPKYLGDDDYGLNLVPSVRVSYDDQFSASVEDGIRYSLFETDNFRAGPLAKIAFGRDEDGSGTFRVAGGDIDDLLGLGDVDTSVELGGFADLDIGSATASISVGQAVSGHDGLVAQLGLRYKGRLQFNGPPLIYSFGPNLNFGDSDFVNAYFGVNETQALASGLPQYEGGGGLNSYGASATAILPLTSNMAMTFISSYTRLTGDVADAPLVIQRGSRDQAFVGAIMSYTFD